LRLAETHWQAAAALTMTAEAGAPTQRPGIVCQWQARNRRAAGSLVRASNSADSDSQAPGPGSPCLAVTDSELGTVSDQAHAADGSRACLVARPAAGHHHVTSLSYPPARTAVVALTNHKFKAPQPGSTAWPAHRRAAAAKSKKLSKRLPPGVIPGPPATTRRLLVLKCSLNGFKLLREI
jgi:hypothetical protein